MKRFLPLLLSVCLLLCACGSSDITAMQNTYTSPPPTEQDIGFTFLRIGDSITLDFVEITLDTASWSDTIPPADTRGQQTYLPDTDGETYLWLCGTLKNSAERDYNADGIVAEFLFGGHTYDAHLIATDNSTGSLGKNVCSLSTVKYYIYTSIPNEIKERYSSCHLLFGFSEEFGGSRFDSFEECAYRYAMCFPI